MAAVKRRAPPLPDGPGPVVAVIIVALVAALDLILANLFPSTGPRLGAAGLWRTAGIRLFEAAALLLLWRVAFSGLKTLFLGKRDLWGALLPAFAAMALLGALALGIEWYFRSLGRPFLASLAPREVESLTALLAAGALIGPVLEELVFTGLIYSSFRKNFNIPASLLVNVSLFALAHAAQGQLPWTQALGGIAFCLTMEYSGALLSPILVHCAGNAAIYLAPHLLLK